MAYFSQDVVDEIRLGNDIVDLIGGYVTLKKNGSDYVGLCPFHKEKTASFHVHRDNQYYHCFGCGAGGNVISFIMEYEGLSFTDAIKKLADRINYSLPENGYFDTSKQELKKRLYEIHKVAARYYFSVLNSEAGLECNNYLDRRALSIPIRRKFGLGFSPKTKGALYNELLSKGYDEADIIASGLVYKKDNGEYFDKFFNRLMFPIIDVYGNIIGFGGRVLGDGLPKYLNSPETPIFNKSRNLYNLNYAKKSKVREFILVEGYMDAIAIYQAGLTNVVASLGTAFNENHAKVLKSYADSVILLFDSDEAGVKAVLRAIPVLKSAGLKIKVLQVTGAKDPDEFIKKYGAQSFSRLVETESKSYILFQAEQARKGYDLNKLEDKIAYANDVAALLQDVDNSIEADAYLKEVARITNIDVTSIQREMEKLNNGVSPVIYKQNSISKLSKNSSDDACREIINLVISEPRVYKAVSSILKPEELVEPLYVKLMASIYKLYEEGKPIIAANMISLFEDVDEQKLVTAMLVNKKEFAASGLCKAVNDLVFQIKTKYIDKRVLEVNDDAERLRLIELRKKLPALHITLTNG